MAASTRSARATDVACPAPWSRHTRAVRIFVLVALVATSACGALLDIQVDGAHVHDGGALFPSGEGGRGLDGAAPAEDAAPGVEAAVPPDSNGQCEVTRKLCRDTQKCVLLGDPALGCAMAGCAPCPATATCSVKGTCELPGLKGWTPENSGTTRNLSAVGGHIGPIYAVGAQGIILKKDSSYGVWTQQPSPTAVDLTAVWISPAGQSFIVGGDTNGGVILSDSSGWTLNTIPKVGVLRGIWGSGYDVYAVGDSGILHYAPSSGAWSVVSGVATNLFLNGIWGSASGDVYAYGIAGGSIVTMLHSAGDGMWAAQSFPYDAPNAMWGFGKSDVYAVGRNIVHSLGDGAWTKQTFPGASNLNGVWSRNSSDIYAVGSSMTILHSDGSAWTEAKGMSSNTLRGIWGNGDSDIYVVGDNGIILRRVAQ